MRWIPIPLWCGFLGEVGSVNSQNFLRQMSNNIVFDWHPVTGNTPNICVFYHLLMVDIDIPKIKIFIQSNLLSSPFKNGSRKKIINSPQGVPDSKPFKHQRGLAWVPNIHPSIPTPHKSLEFLQRLGERKLLWKLWSSSSLVTESNTLTDGCDTNRERLKLMLHCNWEK